MIYGWLLILNSF